MENGGPEILSHEALETEQQIEQESNHVEVHNATMRENRQYGHFELVVGWPDPNTIEEAEDGEDGVKIYQVRRLTSDLDATTVPVDEAMEAQARTWAIDPAITVDAELVLMNPKQPDNEIYFGQITAVYENGKPVGQETESAEN